jgi:hypothetical protein
MISFRRLYIEYNRRYWSGRLPQYRVRRKRLAGLHGLTDIRRRTIWLDSRLQDGELVRQCLLREMCHVAEGRQKISHGPIFWKELGRLVSYGERWAAEEREQYSDTRNRPQKGAFSTLRSRLEELVLNPAGPSMSWREVRLLVAHEHGMSIRKLDRRYPRLKASWRRLRQDELRDRKYAETLDTFLAKGVVGSDKDSSQPV